MRKVLISGLMLACGLAPAASAAGLSATQTVERQVVADGSGGKAEARWVAGEQAASGERLRYAMTYWVAAGDRPVDVALVVPVPEAVRLVENSATSDGLTVTFSCDGGETYAAWDALADRPGEVTHVRWTFPAGAPAGQRGVVSIEAIRE